MITEQEIKDFINFALGDVADPKAFVVDSYKNKPIVILRYPGLINCPKEVVRTEWKRAKENNPQFKDVDLYM